MAQALKSKNKVSSKEILIQDKVITKHQFAEFQKKGGKSGQLIDYLRDRGDLDEPEMMELLSQQYNCQVINIENFDISQELTRLVPYKFCVKHNIIPVSRIGDTVVVACSNPSKALLIKEQFLFLTKCKIEFVIASQKAIALTIESQYEQTEEEMYRLFSEIEKMNIDLKNKRKLKDEDEEDDLSIVKLNKTDPEPIVQCVNQIISCGINKGSSDIHIESYEKTCRVRYRIDGKLQELFHPPRNVANYIISRLKVISQLDISERRKPQDGRLKVCLDGKKEVDFRVSTTPTVSGEKIVLRILDSSNLLVDVRDLGMSNSERDSFTTALKAPQGLILVCGPTGSGKTTTIYSGLKLLNTKCCNISTAEDPVEYRIEGFNQVQVFPKIGLTFASALRSFLRQDPDVMFVGEIRDLDTAETAFKAASTGHLVVSTIHTNDTPSVITRLMDIGIPDYSIVDNITLVVGQRLLRRVCSRCKVTDHISKSSLEVLGLTSKQIEKAKGNIKRGKGCKVCSGIGYKGRVAVFEILKITDKIRGHIFDKLPPMELKKKAIQAGDLRTVRQNGIAKMLEGVTSFEEALYGTKGDE